MAVTVKPTEGPKNYEVLRPIFMAGERVEVGSVITIDNKVVAAELVTAAKLKLSDKPAKLVKAKAPKADKADKVEQPEGGEPPEAPAGNGTTNEA